MPEMQGYFGFSKECWEAWKEGTEKEQMWWEEIGSKGGLNPGTLPALSLSTEATSLWSRWDDILPTLIRHFPHAMSSADQWSVLTAPMTCPGLRTSHGSPRPPHHLSGSEKQPSPMPQSGK